MLGVLDTPYAHSHTQIQNYLCLYKINFGFIFGLIDNIKKEKSNGSHQNQRLGLKIVQQIETEIAFFSQKVEAKKKKKQQFHYPKKKKKTKCH